MKLEQFADIRRRSAREIVASVKRLPARTRTERVTEAMEAAMREEWWRGYWTGSGRAPGGDPNPPDRMITVSRQPGLAYSLDAKGEVICRYATSDQMAHARVALARRARDHASLLTMRSCWLCCPASRHLLQNLSDGFAFRCASCDRVYCEGIDMERRESKK